MFACEHHGVVPDIMPLAKALGGGMVPIGAVVFGQDSLSEDFGLRHTSTFGGNAFCSRVGLGAVDLLTADDQTLVRQVAQRGDYLLAGLREVASRHPELVADVRGQGLLLGVQLSDDPDLHAQQGLFRSLADQEGLAGFLCGYLLRNEGIRLAPAYFANSVLRVEPPLNVSEADCDTLLGALDRGLDVIERGDSARFFAHLLPASERPTAGTSREEDGQELGGSHPERLRTRDGEPRWAFIAHPTDLASYESYDSRLGLPGEQVRVLFDRMNQCRNVDTAAAMLVGRCRVETDTGESSYGEIFALPYGAQRLLDMPSAKSAALVQEAVDDAVSRGAQLVGLGAYTSVITANATALRDVPVPVTTGNAYTVAAAVDGLEQAAQQQGIELGDACCVVLGGAGAIGLASSLLLSEKVGRLVLVGNPANRARSERRLAAALKSVVGHLMQADDVEQAGALAQAVRTRASSGVDAQAITAELVGQGLLTASVDAETVLPAGDLVLAATSTPDQLIQPELVRRGAAVCDVSQPPNVGPQLKAARPDLRVVAGGLVEMPGGRDLGVDFGVPSGVTYACTAETMILAHRLHDPVVSHGDKLSVDLVRMLRDEARKLGYRLYLPTETDQERQGGPHA